jgi:hypothetical protein
MHQLEIEVSFLLKIELNYSLWRPFYGTASSGFENAEQILAIVRKANSVCGKIL